MAFDNWIAFLFLAIIATSTPGPAVLLIMTNATIYGWKKCIYTAIGNIAGLLLMALITVSGLGIILTASELIFSIIKYLGAGYLIYLGISFFFKAEAFSDSKLTGKTVVQKSKIKLFFQAFGVAMGNPKAIIFLSALFPQFIDPNKALLIQFAILISTLMILSFLFLMTYALLGNHIKTFLNRPHRIKIVNRISGAIFIGMGTVLVGVSNK